MFPADVVVGWVKQGRIFFQDRHSTGHTEPLVDASQDWFVLHGEENGIGTIIKTIRKLDTKDSDDVMITNGTINVIYAYSDYEPQTEDGKLRHHSQRGYKSLVLLTESDMTMNSHHRPSISQTPLPYITKSPSTEINAQQYCPLGKPTEKYEYQSVIDSDGKYLLFWNVNKTHITFETHVETKGYVGFGLSHNGNMYPADVIIGWVKDGVPYFKDRHTVGHSPPVVDVSQDWHLLYAKEDNCHTVLKMTRKLDTCDNDDFKISDNTVKIIYSFHAEDPADEYNIPYHGMTRGTRSLLLLSKISPPTIPNDSKDIYILNRNFEVLVDKGHETLVHHVLVHKCPGIDRNLIDSPNYVCYDNPDLMKRPCGHIIVVWAVGAEAFYYPEQAGLPIAEPGDNDLFIMETHYNNPQLRSDFVDNSGVRLTVTPTLRRYDAGILEISAFVDKSQVIPPHQPKFVTTGFCPQACMHEGLRREPNGVQVFAVQQHAHLLARGIRTRLIRKGVEQEPLADDAHYDFNYQDFRRVNRTLKDGGFSTTEEMCVSFLFHYPRINAMNCISKPLYDHLQTDSDPKQMYRADLTDMFLHMDWKNSTVVNQFHESLASSTYFMLCGSIFHQYRSNFTNAHNEYPRVRYMAPGDECRT
ncbi:DBH-like monooxygenase protein 1 [Saccostrea echinata]|uniref:DBH-like monooxygenase protein 1 n=1 Tax=Saccostrea echinata TaxID=191078 RepID=UPI002A7F7D8C|nr:DBH-like monooxygenase protein 1 [Saccostrea echinata]